MARTEAGSGGAAAASSAAGSQGPGPTGDISFFRTFCSIDALHVLSVTSAMPSKASGSGTSMIEKAGLDSRHSCVPIKC